MAAGSNVCAHCKATSSAEWTTKRQVICEHKPLCENCATLICAFCDCTNVYYCPPCYAECEEHDMFNGKCASCDRPYCKHHGDNCVGCGDGVCLPCTEDFIGRDAFFCARCDAACVAAQKRKRRKRPARQ